MWRVIVLAGALVLLSVGLTGMLRLSRVHRFLTARLEAAFGRPVEVRAFDIRLLGGFRIEANSITVGEDPQFGYEYFLRAESLSAGMRWRSLLRGKFEFGTLSFTRPSLNLARGADGHWNLERWLPPPPQSAQPAGSGASEPGAAGPMPPPPPGRLYRIEVDGGRINFKNGADKSPFALVEVRGALDQETPGRWRVDLEARPLRATVALQEAGTIRLRGRIAGTSARLQPAELSLTWEKASLADALRLMRGRDSGVRGSLGVEITARIAPSTAAELVAPTEPAAAGVARWLIHGALRLGGVHRWDLPARADSPALNVLADAEWQAGESRVTFARLAVEAPRSSVRGMGSIAWSPAFEPEIHALASSVDFTDLLAWYRAFRGGVAEDARFEGLIGFDVTLKGWPLQFDAGMVESSGGRLGSSRLRQSVRFGQLSARVKHGRLELQSASLAFPDPRGGSGVAQGGGALRLGGYLASPAITRIASRATPSTPSSSAWTFELTADGQLDRVEELVAAARVLGIAWNRGWSVEGPVDMKMRFPGVIRPYAARAFGEIGLSGTRWQAPYLNQPLLLEKAKIQLLPAGWKVTLDSSRAFGSLWKGTLSRMGDAPWSFDLSGGALDIADLDRWLGPRARPVGLLERLFPSAAENRPAPEWEATLQGLRAGGVLQIAECAAGPLRLGRLRGRVEISGRKLTVRSAEGDFFQGKLSGDLLANLTAQPSYELHLRWERVNLESLANATATLKNRFAGMASGEVRLTTHGIGRTNLVGALEGRGSISVRGGQFRGLDLEASFEHGSARAGVSRFAGASGEFTIGGRKIELPEMRWANHGESLQLSGRVDFARVVAMWASQAKKPKGEKILPGVPKMIRLEGPLGDLRVSVPTRVAPGK